MVLQNRPQSVKGPVPGNGGNGDDTIDRTSSSSSIMDTANDITRSSSSSSSTETTQSSVVASSSNGGVPGGSGVTASSCLVSSSPLGSGEPHSHEQPVIKRQRIEHDRGTVEKTKHEVLQGTSGTTIRSSNGTAPATSTTPSCSTSGNSSNASSACSSSTSLSSSPSCSSTKLIPSSLEHSSDDEQQQPASHHLPPSPQHATTSPNQQHHHPHQNHHHQHHHLHDHLRALDDCHARFQDAIGRQCLCTLDSGVLLACFKVHCTDEDATPETPATVQPLSEWPFEHLLRFLSNVQLVFDTYLRQNIKGNICAGVMELCNYLIRSDEQQHHQHHRPTHNGLAALDIDELIGLCSCSSKYLSYLAGRILSFFLIIVKDDPDDDRWLEKLVANLLDFVHLDLCAVRKINASLEVIKRIVEWKDETEHPLDEDAGGGGGNGNDGVAAAGAIGGGVGHPAPDGVSCRYVTLTDSESLDTTRIKFETINILGGKWSALVKHISSLVRAQVNSSSAAVTIATETCILTFLRLWESIISVKANLSVVETQPFHSQLDSFQLLLLVTKNAVIYRQMLTLFNEALCYGSTLALQDLIPEEVGSLAHNIVRSVKDYRILDKMPKSSYSNHLGFLGYQGQMVRYQDRRLQRVQETAVSPADGGGGAAVVAGVETCYDRTLLQKMALLVLKAVAVIVKEIRCDSSDSSVGSSDSSVDSSDFDMQEIQMIERSIRDVVKKLETFLKAQLEFHPESHLSKVLIHLFDDQDDYLVEAMVCTLDVTSGISFRNNAFPELIAMLNPIYTFIEFSNLGPNITHLFLDLLISPETCFLLFLLRFLKYIRQNWSMFTQTCRNYYQHNSYSNAATLLQSRVRVGASNSAAGGRAVVLPGGALVLPADEEENVILDRVMTVLIRLRMQIDRLVADTLFPYNIAPIVQLIRNCESLYAGSPPSLV